MARMVAEILVRYPEKRERVGSKGVVKIALASSPRVSWCNDRVFVVYLKNGNRREHECGAVANVTYSEQPDAD